MLKQFSDIFCVRTYENPFLLKHSFKPEALRVSGGSLSSGSGCLRTNETIILLRHIETETRDVLNEGVKLTLNQVFPKQLELLVLRILKLLQTQRQRSYPPRTLKIIQIENISTKVHNMIHHIALVYYTVSNSIITWLYRINHNLCFC